MKLLIIEDSARLRDSLNEGLRRSGYAVDLTPDGEQGLKFALSSDYDVIILDLMLPKIDGLTVLRQLRERGDDTAILILSAKDQVQNRIKGLQLGADDYLIKPFDFDELLARINVLVRRNYGQRSPVIQLGLIELNTALHEVRCQDTLVDLTRAETSLFEYLCLNRGRVISVRQLENHLYDSNAVVSKNVIEVHLSTLRKKLKSHGIVGLIKTKRGFGYYIDDK